MILFFMLQFYVGSFIGRFPKGYGIVRNAEFPFFNKRLLLSFQEEISAGNFSVAVLKVLP